MWRKLFVLLDKRERETHVTLRLRSCDDWFEVWRVSISKFWVLFFFSWKENVLVCVPWFLVGREHPVQTSHCRTLRITLFFSLLYVFTTNLLNVRPFLYLMLPVHLTFGEEWSCATYGRTKEQHLSFFNQNDGQTKGPYVPWTRYLWTWLKVLTHLPSFCYLLSQ